MQKRTTRVLLEAVLVPGIFLLSIAFRLWFITLSPQPFIFDQQEYENYTYKIFYHPHMLASHSYRSYPLPLLEAVIYKFAGVGNHQAIYTVHAILDSLVGVMVFILLRYGLKNQRVAYSAYLLYGLNPFTSGYVGTGLSEILSTFFVAATLSAGMVFLFRHTMGWGIVFGFMAGMAAETRNAAFAWAALPIFLTVFLIQWKKHYGAYIGVGIGLIITVLYPLYTNWRDYHELSITKVDSFYAMEFFNGASLKILPPFTYAYPKEQNEMWFEYWSEYYPNRTTEERKALAAKYFAKGFEIVRNDPVDYIRWRFFKMWYVWQKENIFFFVEPGWELRKPIVYYGNIVLLALAAIGQITGITIYRKNRIGRWIIYSFILTILYGTLAFCFSHAEYRLTIPFYPVIIASAALGIDAFLKRVV